jgi:hypothetical protein
MAWQRPGVVDGVDDFIGIDHHKRYSQVLIRDRTGRVRKRGRIPSTRSAFAEFLGPANGRVRMAVHEAGLGYRPLHRWLSELVDTIVLAHPGRLKIVSDTVYKDDALDAERLTELLMVGLVPRAYACSDDAWDRRQLLRQRAPPWSACRRRSRIAFTRSSIFIQTRRPRGQTSPTSSGAPGSRGSAGSPYPLRTAAGSISC